MAQFDLVAQLNRENSALRHQLRDAELVVVALVRAAGGKITLAAKDLVTVERWDLQVSEDPRDGSTIYAVRAPKPAPATAAPPTEA